MLRPWKNVYCELALGSHSATFLTQPKLTCPLAPPTMARALNIKKVPFSPRWAHKTI